MSDYIKAVAKPFRSCYLVGSVINIPSVADIITRADGCIFIITRKFEISITKPSGKVVLTNEIYFSPEAQTLNENGLYVINYKGAVNKSTNLDNKTEEFSYSFYISVVDNHLPLKKWTVTEVLNRLFDLAEPIRRGEKPRFRLEESQAKKFDTILAPEFSFTRQTLRECLQQVGHIVHGEPRITPKKKDGEWYYEVSYDLYGGTRKWMHANRRYIANTLAYTLEQYATQLDTNPENLINKLKHRDGVILDPSAYLFKSVRAEPMYVQITESNMLIATQFPIYTVEKLEFLYEGQSYDITQYLFERSVYNSQLSSYDSQYPYSKAYGLMFTQGEKNITGLNFKQEHPISDIFSQYAIVNIIRQTMGNSNWNPTDFAKLCFRVTYTPYYNARVKQVKTNYTEYDTPAALVYNQSSNLVESRAFGESLKGVIARMGNPEKSRTYMLSRLSQIPKAGMKFDEDYYISAVFTEILPTYIRCTVALTRDFNRISQYIGISSVKRYSQVSEKMAQERNVVYEEYIVFGDFVEQDKDCLIGINLLGQLYKVFRGETKTVPINSVIAWGESFNKNPMSAISLPVVASAYGNSIMFSWEYQDNYSAGAKSEFTSNGKDGKEKVEGYFQMDVPYADYYGRMYYYNFDLSVDTPNEDSSDETSADLECKLPSGVSPLPSSNGYFSTVGKEPFILRKDGREKLQINVQIHFVTNRKGLIIGSALAAYCAMAWAKGDKGDARLYVLQDPIDKFTDSLDPELLKKENSMEIIAYSGGVLSDNNTFPTDGKAWVIATPPIRTEETVENEVGERYSQTNIRGGELLLGQNMEIKKGDEFTGIFFAPKRNVYKGAVWKDKK